MSATLEYKGYNGSVLFSSEDKLLHGSVLGIRDAVMYDGQDVQTLERNFQNAIEEYLHFCKSEGKTPDTPYKGSFNVRVDRDLHKKAALYAVEHDRKLNNVVTEALEEYLSHV